MNKMRFLRIIVGAFIGCASIISLSSCKESSVISKVVEKTYSVVLNLEVYVNNVDSTNLVGRAKDLIGPLNVAADALTFLADKISNEKVAAYVVKAIGFIQTANVLIQSTDTSDAEAFKLNILGYIVQAKGALENAADILGVAVQRRGERGNYEQILSDTADLLNLITK